MKNPLTGFIALDTSSQPTRFYLPNRLLNVNPGILLVKASHH